MAVYKAENGGTVEMPVEMALMIAGDSGACEAFASLSEERKCEYIRRAKSAGTSLRNERNNKRHQNHRVKIGRQTTEKRPFRKIR